MKFVLSLKCGRQAAVRRSRLAFVHAEVEQLSGLNPGAFALRLRLCIRDTPSAAALLRWWNWCRFPQVSSLACGLFKFTSTSVFHCQGPVSFIFFDAVDLDFLMAIWIPQAVSPLHRDTHGLLSVVLQLVSECWRPAWSSLSWERHAPSHSWSFFQRNYNKIRTKNSNFW